MEIVKICAIGIITALCSLILKENKSEIALLVAITGGCIILLSLIDYFIDIFSVLSTIADKSNIPSQLFSLIAKIIGIGYLTEFSAGIVEDSGQKALSEKIILAGKLVIMALSLPVVILLFDTVSQLLS